MTTELKDGTVYHTYENGAVMTSTLEVEEERIYFSIRVFNPKGEEVKLDYMTEKKLRGANSFTSPEVLEFINTL